jgi:6-phosphogluconolactonase/glucosamine-6-phosphate isomerase/deaminase
MKTIVCEESLDLGPAASKWCAEKINAYRARSMYVPAGRTPMALYEEWRRHTPSYLSGLELLQIDDVLTGEHRGVFRRFFEEQLPDNIQQIKFIESGSDQADLAVLGLGLNGHVAFHEPGIPANFYSGSVRLSPITCEHLHLEPGTWGISYGADAFFRSRAVLMMVSGHSKRDILNKLINGDQSLPASQLLNHPDFTLLVDSEALNGIHLPSFEKFGHQGAQKSGPKFVSKNGPQNGQDFVGNT